MASRPTRDFVNLKIAKVISERSTCGRAQVGCVITVNNRIVSTGYNGPPKSMIANNALDCGLCNCDLHEPCKVAIHAEANAIYAAAKAGISLEGGKIYCLYSPCIKCAEAIMQSGIKEVIYQTEYRDTDPIELLKQHGVWVKRLGIE